MSLFAKKIFAVVMLLVFVCLIGTFSVYGISKPTQNAANYWLSRLVRDDVVVVFISPPPGIGYEIKARLMGVGNAGIILNFGRDEAFFSYGNIISIEPAPR